MPRAKKKEEIIIPQTNSAPNLKILIMSILITALFVGGIVFYGQQRIVNKNKQELEQSQQSMKELKTQLEQLQTALNQSNQPQIQGTKYYNEKYGFTIIIPDTWDQYESKESKMDLGDVGEFDSVDVYFEKEKPIFSITMISKDAWDEAQKIDSYKPVKLSENDKFVFAFSFHEDAEQVLRESLRTDIEAIASTFKFENPYQAQIQIEKCAGEFYATKGQTNMVVTMAGKTISSSVVGCYQQNPEVLYSNDKYVYFAFAPSGVGGYILYGKYASLYKLDVLAKTTEIISNGSEDGLVITDTDISPDHNFLVYKTISSNNNEFIIRNLSSDVEKKYKLPVSGDNMQFGNFKFSPNSDKLAIAIGYGPDTESGAIYIFDLATKKFSSYQKFDSSIPYIDSWKDNNDLNLK